MERFLYRLSQSSYRDSFVLKGALLFRIWAVPDTRATRDMDFLAFVDNSLENLVEIVQSTAALEVPDDGLVFDSESVAAERIKEDADYEGVRIRFRAFLGLFLSPMLDAIESREILEGNWSASGAWELKLK